MKIDFDLSLNTLIITVVILISGYLVKGAAWMLVEGMKTLVKKLVETIAKVEVLSSKMDTLTQAVGDVQKIRSDLNAYFERLKLVEKKFREEKEASLNEKNNI